MQISGSIPEIPIPEAALTDLIRSRHEVLFTVDGGLPVEIQWAVAPRQSTIDLDTDRMVERAVTAALGPDLVDVLMPEDEVVYLAAHASKHHWERLGWVVDLDRVIRRGPSLDWGAIAEIAKRGGVLRGLRVGCHLAWILLNADWSARALATLGSDPGAWPVARGLAESMFQPGEAAEGAPESSVVLADFYLRDDVRDRGKLVWRTLMTPTERELGQTRHAWSALAARVQWVAQRAISRLWRRIRSP
jgi:hypothetical protein